MVRPTEGKPMHDKKASPTLLAGCGAGGSISFSSPSLRPTRQCRRMTAGPCANVPAGERVAAGSCENLQVLHCQEREA